MEINDVLQLVAVAVVLAICVAWIVRRLMRRNGGSCDMHDECPDCQLKDVCKGRKPKNRSCH